MQNEANLLVKIKALPLALYVGFVQVVAAHLILVLHEQLTIGHAGSVLNILEVLHSLHIKHPLTTTVQQHGRRGARRLREDGGVVPQAMSSQAICALTDLQGVGRREEGGGGNLQGMTMCKLDIQPSLSKCFVMLSM